MEPLDQWKCVISYMLVWLPGIQSKKKYKHFLYHIYFKYIWSIYEDLFLGARRPTNVCDYMLVWVAAYFFLFRIPLPDQIWETPLFHWHTHTDIDCNIFHGIFCRWSIIGKWDVIHIHKMYFCHFVMLSLMLCGQSFLWHTIKYCNISKLICFDEQECAACYIYV